MGGVTRGDEDVAIRLVEGVDVVTSGKHLRHDKRRIRVTHREVGHVEPEIGGHQLAKLRILYLVRSGHDPPRLFRLGVRRNGRTLPFEPCPFRNTSQPMHS